MQRMGALRVVADDRSIAERLTLAQREDGSTGPAGASGARGPAPTGRDGVPAGPAKVFPNLVSTREHHERCPHLTMKLR